MAANLVRVESQFAVGSQLGPILWSDSCTCAGLQVVPKSSHRFEELLPPTSTELELFGNSASK